MRYSYVDRRFFPLMAAFLLVVVVLPRNALAQSPTTEPSPTRSPIALPKCSNDLLDAYMECVADNPCLCSNCDPNPTDDFPQIDVPKPDDCFDLKPIFCPMFKCCSACEQEAEAWYSCSYARFSLAQLGKVCTGECTAFPFEDVLGDCRPTELPSKAPTKTPTTVPPTRSPVASTPTPTPPSAPSSSPTKAPLVQGTAPTITSTTTTTGGTPSTSSVSRRKPQVMMTVSIIVIFCGSCLWLP